MEIYEAFESYLNNYTPLTALIGTNQIFPDFIPQHKDVPALTYQLISDAPPEYTFSGEADIKEPVYQFSCFAYTDIQAYAIYKQIKAAFKNFQGLMGDLYIQGIFIVTVLGKDYDPATGRHSYKVDFQFHYNN